MKNLRFYFPVLLFALLLFQSCEKETIDKENTKDFKVSRISIDEFNSNVLNNRNFNNLSDFFDSNKIEQKNSTSDSTNLASATILTDEVLHVQEGLFDYYTFKISTATSGDEFYNLLVEVDDQDEIVKQQLIRYNPSTQYILDNSQPFSGDAIIIDHPYLSLDTNHFKTELCVEDMTGGWRCSEGNEHYQGHPACTQATSWEYVVTISWGPCPNMIDVGDSMTAWNLPPLDNSNDPGTGTSPNTGNVSRTIPLTSCVGPSVIGSNSTGFTSSVPSSACMTAGQMIEDINLLLVNNLNVEEKNWILASSDNADKAYELYQLLEQNYDPDNDSAELAFRLVLKLLIDDVLGLTDDDINSAIESLVITMSSVTSPEFMTYFSLEFASLKRDHPDWDRNKLLFHAALAAFQTALDLVGLIPGAGEFADIANGLIYTANGDGVNAGLSFGAAVPLAGWSAAGIKAIRKYDRLRRVTFKVSYDVSTNTYKFVGRSGKLRKALGLAKGDPRIVHHIIPQEFINHPAIQKAAGSSHAFHIDEALNGFPLDAVRHTGSHPSYSSKIQTRLDAIDLSQSADDIFSEISEIINDAANALSNSTVPVNQIVF